ncbi:S-methyl-5'-thioadenosine phosphorylase [Tepidiforma flava]|uniref:S-methyl-5'-thioadenosine phosphorylase n=1 Tax=Tepidiforma flava TaxID=3004094 RepID=A0ABY7M4N5_9CHLR|nr:S-methyl-5'-thioadenosine phosphorylase [Tepidiforma flava]WBL35498.1 S-methyl-5'-thioadenosine phosphorylase [Tepidiforma flava]
MSESIPLAVIGGSGFYDMPGLEDAEELEIATPFGPPSDRIRVGTLGGRRVAFLARHGRHHTILPSELPQRANFWALKQLGVERVLSVSAVGSLREVYAPGHLVVPSQLIDRTWGRPSTFFGDGLVGHISFAEPFCPRMRQAALAAARCAGATVHEGGTYVVMQGPAFSTRAESELHRAWGADLIGMTALPEAKLAREAELCYATLACVTDYDCWHETEAAVDAATVFETLRRNVAVSQEAVRLLAGALPPREGCACATALDAAIVAPRAAVPAEVRERLAPILRRWLEAGT